jgi:Leucine-rich repeat (LRR) protein
MRVLAQDDPAQSAAPDTSAISAADSVQWVDEKIYKTLAAALKNKSTAYRLDLSRTKLKAIPQEVFQLKELRELNLSNNKITQLPKEIALLSKLTELNLSNNRIAEVPQEIGQLNYLKVLRINRNELTTIPKETGLLKKLEILDMWSNEIDSLPSEIQNLSNLKELELRGILISDPEQVKIKALLPNTKIFMSPSCNCKY